MASSSPTPSPTPVTMATTNQKARRMECGRVNKMDCGVMFRQCVLVSNSCGDLTRSERSEIVSFTAEIHKTAIFTARMFNIGTFEE